MDSELIGLLIDSFGKILLPGLAMTLPLTAISFALALIIAVAAALVQFANVRVLSTNASWYGVTYKEDADKVKAVLAQMHENGVYPKLT